MRLTLSLFSSVVHKRSFFVTTPIFYVNAAPHIGHLYTALVADTIQRFEKLTNPDCNVIFSTGTDEHGTKIQQAAAKANKPPQEYCNQISAEYKKLFKDYSVDYTDFIRTTEDRHKNVVRHFWNKLVERDNIYKAKYSGWYSVNDESFVPETHVKDELRNGQQVKVSIESGHVVEWTEEVNYMFRLSAFKTDLQNWLKEDGVITPRKFQVQLQELVADDKYLPDISVSRPASRVHWAIPVPNDPDQSIYVWVDALVNYLTVSGYPDSRKHWPADVHVVGKDILKFHGLYWPSLLMASGLHPPRRIVSHSHWTVDDHKISKSKHNAISPNDIAATSGEEPLRYLLLREATMAHDANFSTTKFINTINSELADTLGNLVSRCVGSTLNPLGEVPALHTDHLAVLATTEAGGELMERVLRLPAICFEHYSNYQFYKVVDATIQVLHIANLFFETTKPWELRKQPENQKQLDVILHITMETLRICGIILQPIIPKLSEKLLDKLLVPKGCRSWRDCENPSWTMGDVIHEARNIQTGKFVLFQRIYKDKKDTQDQKKKKASVP